MINKLNNQIVIYFTCYNFNISFTVRTSEFVMQSDNFNRCAVFQMSPMSTVITFGPFYKCQTNNMFEFLWLEFMTNTALFTLIYFFFISAVKRVINLCGFPGVLNPDGPASSLFKSIVVDFLFWDWDLD